MTQTVFAGRRRRRVRSGFKIPWTLIIVLLVVYLLYSSIKSFIGILTNPFKLFKFIF